MITTAYIIIYTGWLWLNTIANVVLIVYSDGIALTIADGIIITTDAKITGITPALFNFKGIRPGTETVEYLEGVVTRITWGGAFFLAAISILPYAIFTSFGLPVFFGGTGIIIVVGVAIDTVQQINAHLIMREYKGFI